MTSDEDFFDKLAGEALRSGSPVLDVVGELICGPTASEGLRVVEFGDHMATLVSPSRKLIRIFQVPERPEALSALVDRLLEHNPRSGSEVVIVGGGARESELIRRAVPELLMFPFVIFHRTDAGKVLAFPEGKGRKSFTVSALSRTRALSLPERRKVLERIVEHANEVHAERKERSRFFRRLDARVPRATYALLALIALCFFLQTAWQPRISRLGEESELLFLISVGALFRPLVMEGEIWRMISVGFLHGNVLHIGANCFALYLLGGQMERVLGTQRFVLLYFAALLGGSLASLLVADRVSVGASGAVWGLLGAQAALAFGMPKILPKSVAAEMKPLAKQNVLINAGISLLPMVDGAAHFGGGIAGALLLASGVLYRTSGGSSEQEQAPASASASRPLRGAPAWVPPATIICSLVMGWGVLKGFTTYEPWAFSSEFEKSAEQLLPLDQL